MNPELLMKYFDRISDAPDAIPRLRQFILDLAVRGKLVKQDRTDEPAADMLKRIRSTMELRVKPLPPLDNGELPFILPASWESDRLGNLLELQYGKALPAEKRKESGPVAVYGSNGIVGFCAESLVNDPAIIVGRKGSAGALNVALTPSWTTDVAYFISPPACFELRFLLYLLKTLRLESLSRGIKPGLSRAEAYQLPIVIPPFSEQYRIVAKIDELMALCDRLEGTQREREVRRARFTLASHHQLNNGTNAEVFRGDAKFCLSHLPRLTTCPDQIKQLRQTILNLAVHGRLVPQDPNDEPASFLLQRLIAETLKYTREQKLAASTPERIKDDAIPYPAPRGWAWTRLCSICKVVTDGDHQPPPKSLEGVAFLTIGNVTTGSLDFSNCRFVPQTYLELVAEYRKPALGDILYTVVGATYGRPILVDTERPFCVQRHIAILKPASEVNVKFLRLLLASPLVYEQATRSVTGAAQPTIALKPLRNFLIPLPPVNEQHRIVAKIEQLISICDRLEAQLATTQLESTHLLESVLHHSIANPEEPIPGSATRLQSAMATAKS